MKNPFEIRSALSKFLISAILTMSILAGCKKDDPVTPNPNSDIPVDSGGAAPATTVNNITTIGATFQKTPGNESRVQINMLGVLHPITGQPIQFTANSSVWVTEDSVLKGIKVTAAGGGTVLGADVVFVVDNSGSMGQEADSVARKIIAFANFLEASGLNVRLGCVGHGRGSDQRVYGALNLTSANALQTYLNRTTVALSRTVGFSGPDSAALAAASLAGFYSSGGGENSVIGITFADSLFSWRSNANRVYVAFTDEPTQPGGSMFWSTQGLISRWTTAKGTIHTVYSEDTVGRTWTPLQNERPWDLATLTGGTKRFIPSNAAGLDLTTLPVTTALASSALIEFVSANPNIAHNVTITVKGATTADGKKRFTNITY